MVNNAGTRGADQLGDIICDLKNKGAAMKKVILGVALCGAAVGLAGAANADGVNSDFLSGSTDALILGPTGIPTPDAAYISDAENLYLDPNGYDGTTATTLALTTPETDDFGPSVTQGEDDLINAVVADYDAGDMDCSVGMEGGPRNRRLGPQRHRGFARRQMDLGRQLAGPGSRPCPRQAAARQSTTQRHQARFPAR